MKSNVKRLLADKIGYFYKLPGARIFYFHSIHPSNQRAVRPDIFQYFLELLLREGKQIITIKELGQRIRNGHNINNFVSISFDDGYKDNVDIALPILNKFNIKATFFIVANLLNCLDNKKYRHVYNMYKNLPVVDKEDMFKLVEEGMEIGSHGLSHRFMGKFCEKEFKIECHKSKDILEKTLNIKIYSFAYPNGEVPKNAESILKETGYMQAVTARWDCINKKTNIFRIPRQIIYPYFHKTDLKFLLSGRYDYVKIVQSIKRFLHV